MKTHLSTAGRLALGAALALSAAAAHAQSASNAGTTAETAIDDGEIVVTANKRLENVQDVPLAVSVVGQAALDAANVRNFQDLGKIAPSLTIRPAEHPVNSNVSLRGVGTFAFGIGVESSVAVLVDEVPLSFSARAFTDLPDVDRIEVLRGPQSTLYGKSASAGLINIITRNPSDELQLKANALVATDREYGANFSVSGPLSDSFGYVLSGSYSTWDGNVKNEFNGKRVNGREAVNLRGKLRWSPNDDIKITLSGNYVNGNTDVGRPFVRMDPAALLRNTAGQTAAVTMPGVTVGLRNQDISNNYNARTRYDGAGGNLRGEFGLLGGTLVSITSYDNFTLDDFLDQDDTSSQLAIGNNIQVGTFKSELVTQEIRFVSGDGPIRYTVGAYFADVKFKRPFFRGPAFSLANWNASANSQQIAGFAQVDWTVVQGLILTGGVRIQNEKVSYTFLDRQAGNAFFSGRTEDTADTWRGTIRYEFDDDISVFATYSTGYKGKTYDLTTGFNANRAAAGPIQPERSRDIEFGFRGQFLDRRLTLNLTYFDTIYKGLQAQTIETFADGSTNFRLTNVGRLGTKGLEIEATARSGDDFTFGGAMTFLDARYLDFPVAQCYPLQTAALGCTGSPARQNLTGTRAIQAPELRFTVNAEWTPSITDNLRGIVQANLQHTSSVQYTSRDPETFQAAYDIVNVGLGVRSEKRNWEVVAFVNNLFDKQYFPALVNTAGNFGGRIATQALLPRDYRRYAGVRFGVNF